MIKIEKQGDYTQTTISGSLEELFNDCKALIKSLYMNEDFGDVFLKAWDSTMKERKSND